MKSRTSFFNPGVLRKDITRFLPVWLIYLIGSLLVGIENMGGYSHGIGYKAQELGQSIAAYGVLNFIYALICAQVLFGDLFNSKLCNALHAMPVRRESWFLTHTVAGIAFSLVPNAVLCLLYMPYMDGMWYVSLIWLLGVTLQYLFFFGLAALSAICAGNRLGMAAIYGIANFLSLIAAWFISNFYEPQLYGLHLDYQTLFFRFCPVLWITDLYDLVVFDTAIKFPNPSYSSESDVVYTYMGLSADWWYLAVLAVLGVAFLALSLVLYRKRKLESAGDLLSFRPLQPVFCVIFTLCAGALFQMFSVLFTGNSEFLFLIVGLVVGYFVCQMMLQRTVKVFRKMAFVKCAAICLALLGSILLTALDPLGITRWVPDPEQVDEIIISDNYNFELQWYEENNYRGSVAIVDNPVLIRELTEVHELVLNEDRSDQYDRTGLHLTYRMKDGRTIQRRYYHDPSGPAGQKMKQFFGTPEYVLGYQNWNAFLDSIDSAYLYLKDGSHCKVEPPQAIAAAVRLDCEVGDMSQSRNAERVGEVDFELNDGRYLNITIYADSENTLTYIKYNCQPALNKEDMIG